MPNTSLHDDGPATLHSQDGVSTAPFSLAPAIFFPLNFTPAPTPISHIERLNKIIENVTRQQEIVRGNMVTLIQQRANTLIARAQAELAALEGTGDGMEQRVRDEKEHRQKERREIDALMASLKAPMKGGAKGEYYEVKSPLPKLTTGLGLHESEDVEMGNNDMSTTPTLHSRSRPRTRHQILSTLNATLRELINRSISELTAYDMHAQGVISHYKQALARRGSKSGGVQFAFHGDGGLVSSPTAHSPKSTVGAGSPYQGSPTKPSLAGRHDEPAGKGILKNRSEQSPIDDGAIRRLSTGMPVFAVEKRTAESRGERMADLVRRGSK